MPKPTIKSLQEEINTLRELREDDRAAAERLRYELSVTEKRLTEAIARCEALDRDKRWLQQITAELSTAVRTRS